MLKEGRVLRFLDPARSAEVLSRAIESSESTRNFQRLPDLRFERALAYVAIRADDQAQKDLAPALAEIESQRAKISEESLRVSFLERSQRVYDLLTRIDAHRGRAEAALETVEKARARVLLDLVSASGGAEGSVAASPDLSLLREAVAPGTALVEYALLEDRLLIWIIQRRGIDLEQIPLREKDLESAVESFRHGILSGTNPAGTAWESNSLYRRLIEPVIRHWRGKRLVLVPDKALNALPFAALMNPATGRYLIEDFEVSLVPSGQLFMLSASRDRELARESFSPSVLIVANPSFSRKIWSWLPDLDKGASKEGENVAKLFPGAKLLQGAAATREGFLRSLGDAEIVHFAGHAVVDREAPLSSGLILAPSYNGDSGLLRTKDLFRLSLPKTRLVVLGACGTASGPLQGGEGALSLARPFLAAGVPSVVASLWSVDDQATAEILETFYKSLAQGEDSVKALRVAQLAFLAAAKDHQEGLHRWAAFVHLGNANLRQ